MKSNPLLSIIIPQYNEEKDILDCLESLSLQTYKNFEIIVIDDGSTDNSLKMIKDFAKKNKKIKILEQNHRGPGIARNLGAEESKGEILVFVDADMTFDKDYLKNLIQPILNENENAIGTENEIQSSNYKKNIWTRCAGKWSFDGTYETRKIFRALRKDKFFEMGCFDPKYGYADDQTFFLKYGVNPKIAKGSICYHKNPETLRELYGQNRWMGASIDNFTFEVPIIKYFVPFLLILISPMMIPILSIRKSHKNNDWKNLFPWMFIFMAVRYFGTVSGIFRKIFLNKNMR